MVAKKKKQVKRQTKKQRTKKTRRVQRKAPAPVMAVPDIGKLMETGMKGIVAVTAVGVMGGIAGSVIARIP